MSLGHHSIFEDQARELYFLCDKEKKGFITKEDMYRLSSHLSLSIEQIESVFDSLDDDNNGNLTLEEFIVGFSKFLGAPVEIVQDDESSSDGESSTMNQAAQEHLEHLVGRMKIVGLTEDVEMIRETWNKLQNTNTELLNNFEILIENIIADMLQTKNEYSTLESVLKNKSSIYDEELKRLYDEMEVQIKSEKERVLNEEKKREKEIKDTLEKEIREKDEIYQDNFKAYEKTTKELIAISNIHSESNQERERLEKERNEVESKLRLTDKSLRDCQEYIDELNRKGKQDRRNRAKAAIEMTEGIALERETLVRQLDELRERNRILEAENARKAKQNNQSDLSKCNDLYKELNHACEKVEPTVVNVHDFNKEKRGSILSSYFAPPITIDHLSFDNCQSISYDDYEDPTELGMSVNGSTFSPLTAFENDIMLGTNARPVSMKSQLSVCQEIEVQTEMNYGSNDLGDRTPPDGAVSEMDIMNGIEKPERIFKVVFIGDSSVGKTSIIKRFCNDEFKNEGMASTIGVDFQIKSIRVDGSFVALQLWDTAGQERFRSITSHYYRKSDGVILVYDILSESSLINLRQWMQNVKDVVEDETVILILGNKCDMINDESDKHEANRLKSILNVENVLYFCCSAKTGENIKESFQVMAKNLMSKENNDLKSSIKLDNSLKKKGCCSR